MATLLSLPVELFLPCVLCQSETSFLSTSARRMNEQQKNCHDISGVEVVGILSPIQPITVEEQEEDTR